MPIAVNKIRDISELSDELSKHNATLRLHIDHPDQIAALEAFETQKPDPRKWSVFVKVDAGGKYVGIPTLHYYTLTRRNADEQGWYRRHQPLRSS